MIDTCSLLQYHSCLIEPWLDPTGAYTVYRTLVGCIFVPGVTRVGVSVRTMHVGWSISDMHVGCQVTSCLSNCSTSSEVT